MENQTEQSGNLDLAMVGGEPAEQEPEPETERGEPVIHLGGGEPKSKAPLDAVVTAYHLPPLGHPDTYALEIASSVDEEQVADIFVRINSEGVKLNAELGCAAVSVARIRGARLPTQLPAVA